MTDKEKQELKARAARQGIIVDLAEDLNPPPHPSDCECERCLYEAQLNSKKTPHKEENHG